VSYRVSVTDIWSASL